MLQKKITVVNRTDQLAIYKKEENVGPPFVSLSEKLVCIVTM